MKEVHGRIEKELIELSKVRKKINNMHPIVKDFYYYLEAADKSYTTIKTYINYICHFINYCYQQGLYDDFYLKTTPTLINMYMASMRFKTNKSGQVLKTGNEIRATRWSALNTFFMYLKSNGIIENNPVEQTLRPSCKKEKKVTYLSEDEIQICFDNITVYASQKMVNRDMCIISLGIASGLRVSAITQINMEDVDLQDCTIRVTEKGNKHRVIYFGKNLKEKLVLWIADREKYFSEINTNALFVSQKKQRISVAAVEGLIKKYTINIDKKITPHKLRATCATNLYKKTNDIYLVATQLGHANIATTKIYTEVDTDSKLKAAQILDTFV